MMTTSVKIVFKNKKDMNEMIDFLNSQQSLIDQIKESDENIQNLCILDKDQLNDNTSNKYVLGYQEGSHKFVWSLAAWIATKAGIKDKNGDGYILYNTIKRHVREKTKDDMNEIIVNKDGIQIFCEDPLVKSLKMLQQKENNNINYDIFNTVTRVLEELNINWNKYILEDATSLVSLPKNKM